MSDKPTPDELRTILLEGYFGNSRTEDAFTDLDASCLAGHPPAEYRRAWLRQEAARARAEADQAEFVDDHDKANEMADALERWASDE